MFSRAMLCRHCLPTLLVRQRAAAAARPCVRLLTSKTTPNASSAPHAQDGHQQTAESWEVNIRSSDPNYLRGPRESSWWTGKKPEECPGVDDAGKIFTLSLPNLSDCTRQEVLDYFDNTWTSTEVLFSALQGEEAFYREPAHQLRHPLIFYTAHPASLYINKMRVAGLLDSGINDYYEHIFETGVDEMSWDDLSKNAMRWPSVEEVLDYRRQVYERVANTIMTHPEFASIGELEKSPFWSLVLGFEHERIHLETSSVLMRELPIRLVRQPEHWPEIHPSAAQLGADPTVRPKAGVHYPENAMVAVPGGSVTIGKPRDYPSFGWDNEYGSKTMNVKSFEASKYMISNGEFHEFLKSGGYADERWWTAEGWQWRTFRNVKWPTFWEPSGPTGLHQYRLRTTFQEIDMPWSWPAVVNCHEARAYARWRSEGDGTQYRIGTEAEHNIMRDPASFSVKNDLAMVASGERMRELGVNLNLAYGSENPVDAHQANPAGVVDLMGNVWEWHEDCLNALPGFKIHQYYEDFSLPCFDGKHQLILGGSFASTGDEASTFARFHFRPHFYQHAGFRLYKPNENEETVVTSCLDNPGPYVGSYPFRRSSDRVDERGEKVTSESVRVDEQTMLQQQVFMHYGQDTPAGVPSEALGFPSKCAKMLVDAAKEHGVPTNLALDLGCGTGGCSFELARAYKDVLAMDISEDFIETARQIQQRGSIPSVIQDEGDLYHEFEAAVPTGVEPSRVSFKVGDAMCLAPDLGPFDAVVLANVVDRLAVPSSCLGRMGGKRGVVAPGGLLMVTSPFSWGQAYTPKELWLGGYRNSADVAVRSMDGLRQVLEPSFTLLSEQPTPFVVREHARKYEYIIASTSIWKNNC